MTPRRAAAGRVSETTDDHRLLAVASLFTLAVILHGLDHLRRGVDTVSLQVFWAGTLAMAIEIAVVLLALRRRGGLESATRERRGTRPLTAGLKHPATLAMIGGNSVLLVGSIVQLA